jgi:hypothetical protein
LFAQLSLAARAGPWGATGRYARAGASERRSPAATAHARHQQHERETLDGIGTRSSRQWRRTGGLAVDSTYEMRQPGGHAYSMHSEPAGRRARLVRRQRPSSVVPPVAIGHAPLITAPWGIKTMGRAGTHVPETVQGLAAAGAGRWSALALNGRELGRTAGWDDNPSRHQPVPAALPGMGLLASQMYVMLLGAQAYTSIYLPATPGMAQATSSEQDQACESALPALLLLIGLLYKPYIGTSQCRNTSVCLPPHRSSFKHMTASSC